MTKESKNVKVMSTVFLIGPKSWYTKDFNNFNKRLFFLMWKWIFRFLNDIIIKINIIIFVDRRHELHWYMKNVKCWYELGSTWILYW